MSASPNKPDPASADALPVSAPPAPLDAGVALPDPADNSPTFISANRPKAGFSPEAMAGLQGQRLGHFEVGQGIGKGGMAAVLKANDLQLGRIVALKVLPPDMAADPENIARFKQEARSAARLDHENIARVFYCGEDRGLHFIAFEFVDGVDLRTLLSRQGPLSPSVAVKYMLQVASGLAHAAERGVTHRDIKPSNIIITPEGRAKIVDMGLARTAGVPGGVTQSGMTLGTFDYISPEQALEPRNADARSDIYSLGCTFYHLLTGVPPVPEGTAAKKLHHHQNILPADPRKFNSAISDDLAAIIGKMMAKDPRDRYQRPADLIQHLLIIARTMDLAGDSGSQERVLFMDTSLPSPRVVSPLLVGVAAVAAVALLAVALSLGGGSGLSERPTPSVARSPDTSPRTNPAGDAPAIPTVSERPVAEPRPAATVADLVRLLSDGVDHIVLTAEEYDLTGLVADAAAQQRDSVLPEVKRRVRLVGKRPEHDRRPIVRCRMKSPQGPGVSFSIFSVMGPASSLVELHGIRVEIDAAGAEGTFAAVAARGIGRLAVTDCEFVQNGKPESGMCSSISFAGSGLPGSALDVEKCWFVGGMRAIWATNRAQVHARQCAFGPHESAIQFDESGVPAAPNPDRLLAELDYCSVLVRDGVVFDAGNNVAGTIRTGNSVFALSGDAGEGILVRQRDPRQPLAVMGPGGGARARNVYCGLTFWADPAPRAATIEACRRLNLSMLDPDAVELPTSRTPWRYTTLPANARPEEAFLLHQTRPELRVLHRPDRMVGVWECTWGVSYPAQLPATTSEPPEAITAARVVDPSMPTDERLRRYRTLEAALADTRGGECTILIRAAEPLEVSPQELSRSNLRLTIKAEGAGRPVLALAENDTPNSAMFTLHNGSLTLQGLHLRLKPAVGDDSRGISAVILAGTGQVSFDDCIVTLETNDETQPALVTLLSDPENAAKFSEKRLPKIRLNDCFVRGRGQVVCVRGSRPFELETENVLAALHGSFLSIWSQPKDPPLSPHAQAVFKRTTAFVSDSVLELRAGDADKKVPGLVPTSVRAEDCLFVASADRPLVFASGTDRDHLTRTLLTWEGTRNLYGNFPRMLEVKSGTSMAMMMAADWSQRDWIQFTREADDSFGRVTFARSTTDERPLARSVPNDFRAKLSDMRKTDANATDYGAALNQLPKIDEP